MATSSEFDAKMDMKAFIDRALRPYSEWYAGIAADPRERLFNDHGVSEEREWWITRECDKAESARRVEEYLLKLGCDGAAGGDDDTTTGVYAYLKGEHTTP